MSYPLRGLVLEGVSGIGKSTLIEALRRDPDLIPPRATFVFVSEHYTERVLEDDRGSRTLTPTQAFRHTDGLLRWIRTLAALKTGSKFADREGNAEIVVIVERWTGSMLANLATDAGRTVSAPHARGLARQVEALRALGLETMLLLASREDELSELLTEAGRSRNEVWKQYLAGLGGAAGPEGAARFLWRWQGNLVSAYAPSRATRVAVSRDSRAAVWDAAVGLMTRMGREVQHRGEGVDVGLASVE